MLFSFSNLFLKDRVLENYRDFLSAREDCKGKRINSNFIFVRLFAVRFYDLDLSLKPAEELIHDLSFLSKTKILPEVKFFPLLTDKAI